MLQHWRGTVRVPNCIATVPAPHPPRQTLPTGVIQLGSLTVLPPSPHPTQPPDPPQWISRRGASLLILPYTHISNYQCMYILPCCCSNLSCLRLATAIAETRAEAIGQYDGQPSLRPWPQPWPCQGPRWHHLRQTSRPASWPNVGGMWGWPGGV